LNQPLVSIAMPAWNAGPYLADAVRSVFAQTYTSWELLIADDGSTDGSIELARAIRDDRIRVLGDGQRRGGGNRLNEITRVARGALVARMDADDLMHPRRIEHQVRYLTEHPDIDVLGTGTIVFSDRATLMGRRTGAQGPTRASVLAGAHLGGATVMAKTSFFHANPFDPRYEASGDFELFCRVAPRARAAVLQEALYFYRELHSRNARKYLTSYVGTDRILRFYGPSEIGQARTLALRVRNCVGMVATATAIALGKKPWLVRRRSLPLSPAESTEADGALATVFATRLPGID
jgi:glycosyltransferase involved in cell wall biosynthesis